MVKIIYHFSNNEAHSMIEKIKYVINKLPKKIQEKLNEKCAFILLGETYGFFSGDSKKNFIILDFFRMNQDNLTLNQKHFVIAHEIAHFILDHKNSSKLEENEANDLVKSWKFDLK